METLCKFVIKSYAFRLSKQYERTWQAQVLRMHKYWNKMIWSIDRIQFNVDLTALCNRYNLSCKHYDLDKAFSLATSSWRVELITDVCNTISRFFTDECSNNIILVKWNDKKSCTEFCYKLI